MRRMSCGSISSRYCVAWEIKHTVHILSIGWATTPQTSIGRSSSSSTIGLHSCQSSVVFDF